MFLISFKYLYTYFKFNNTALNTCLCITSKYVYKLYVITFYDIHFYMINKFQIIAIP